MADRIAVLNNGRIEQIGSPEDIYQRPATPFVADFMGADNKISASELFAAEGIYLRAVGQYSAEHFHDHIIYFRSADAALDELSESATPEGLTLSGVVEQSAFLGNLYRHSVRCHDRSPAGGFCALLASQHAGQATCSGARTAYFSFITSPLTSSCSFWG